MKSSIIKTKYGYLHVFEKTLFHSRTPDLTNFSDPIEYKMLQNYGSIILFHFMASLAIVCYMIYTHVDNNQIAIMVGLMSLFAVLYIIFSWFSYEPRINLKDVESLKVVQLIPGVTRSGVLIKYKNRSKHKYYWIPFNLSSKEFITIEDAKEKLSKHLK